MTMHDVVVLGAGPAGLSLAEAAAAKGLDVAVVSPSVTRAWEPVYGAWQDEVVDPRYHEVFEATWAAPLVWTGESEKVLDRRYARFHTPDLQSLLLGACDAARVQRVEALAVEVQHEARHTRVFLSNGAEIEARVVVDATGPQSRFIRRAEATHPAFQMAYGQLIEVDHHPFQEGEMAFMDMRHVQGTDPGLRPTFLYAMPLGARLIFVEETSLVGRPAMGMPELQGRLRRRLVHLGITPRAILGEERCRIPMGLAVPRKNQRILGFGVSASMVHPASGFQLARTLSMAPRVAETLATHLASDPSPVTAVREAWDTLWPRERMQAWELYTFGMEFLCTLNANQTRAFFDTFFRLDQASWQGFLSATLSPADLARVMADVFAKLDAPLRWELMRAGASARGLPLLRAAVAY